MSCCDGVVYQSRDSIWLKFLSSWLSLLCWLIHVLSAHIINPRRACAARVTVVGSVCVCVSVNKSHLTSGASVRPENTVTYSAGNGGRNICGDFSETAPGTPLPAL